MGSYRLKYTGIRVKDMDESLQFYTGVLGMDVVDKREPTPPTNGEVVTLRSSGGDQLLELNWYAEGSRFGPPYVNGEELDHLAFDVDDLDGWVNDDLVELRYNSELLRNLWDGSELPFPRPKV